MPQQVKISVSQGYELAASEGLHLSKPTVLAHFKNSGLCIKLGGRYFMPKDAFLQILRGTPVESEETR